MLNSLSQTRRHFIKTSALATAALSTGSTRVRASNKEGNPIRLGAPTVGYQYDSPKEWVAIMKKLGLSAAYCPVGANTNDQTIRAYEDAAMQANIIIAETGAWSNPLSADPEERKKALEKCTSNLDLADKIGARCCVNIAGSRGKEWAGHDPKNFTEETFEMIVEVTREIIDAVKPKRSYFTLETMPWNYPDSADSYLRLINAIDREHFAAHLDPVNLICSPQRYYSNAEIIRDCFAKFGKHIRSCHAKDIILRPELTTHLDECRPGQGNLDYAVFLRELSKLKDVPLMIEHLPNAEEYRLAAVHIRSVGKANGFTFA